MSAPTSSAAPESSRRGAPRGKRAAWLPLVVLGIAGAVAGAATASTGAEPRIGLPAAPDDASYRSVSPERVSLGRLLFYDKILSGNRNIACGTCHHHDHASGDGLSLPVGEGGVGVGPERTVGSGESMIERRVPRNSPALFNLGAQEFRVLFHDGRLSVQGGEPSGFDSPAGDDLPSGLANVVAAQAMFPMLSATEMAGEVGENDVIDAVEDELVERDEAAGWERLATRLREIPEYVEHFRAAFPDVRRAEDVTMVHAANAIGDFVSFEWRADGSPFDRYLRGEEDALTALERRGLALFYGSAGCSRCHSGAFQTDHGFHAISMPQIGYVRTRAFDPVVRDMGRVNETDAIADRYRFRTPSLRNVAHTAPYGHSGAYRTLEAVVRHHLDPRAAFAAYDARQAVLPPHPVESTRDLLVAQNAREIARLLAANELEPVDLGDDEIAALLAFLGALTDPESLDGRLGRPDSVPSGLPVD